MMAVFKSINLAEDFSAPERAAHYRPTRNSLDIVKAVFSSGESRATSIIASYGAGKSLAALVGGLLVEGSPQKKNEISKLVDRIKGVDPVLGSKAESRLNGRAKGSVFTLSGYIDDLPGRIRGWFGMSGSDSLRDTLKSVNGKLKSNELDQVAIIWDEFGRHLQSLASKGNPENLAEVQDLAEWAVRQNSPSVTFTTLLHQNFQQYADGLSQTGQAEWRKIEGRFDSLQIVEDGDEILDVIASAVSAKGLHRNRKKSFVKLAEKAREIPGQFQGMTVAKLSALLEKAWPLTPPALALLPKVAARIGQNQRTLHSFIGHELEGRGSKPVYVEEIYEYFSESFRMDTGPGGTYKMFLEADSARERAESDLERQILAATCMFQMGSGGERKKLSKGELVAIVETGCDVDSSESTARKTIKRLLEKKLLLHREHTDDISVWQGSGVDIPTIAREKEKQIDAGLNSGEALQKLSPAPAYLAPSHNFRRSVTRYARGTYLQISDLFDRVRLDEIMQSANEQDALVLLITDATIKNSREILKIERIRQSENVIVALPRKPAELREALLRANALDLLFEDRDQLGDDPMIEREIVELRSSALEFLTNRLEILCEPDNGHTVWFSEGKSVDQGFAHEEFISGVFDQRFSETPVFRNEQIVRRNVSSQSKNSRKKCVLGILERTGQPHLGYEGSTSRDASVYRTIFQVTGLYRFCKASHCGLCGDGDSRNEEGCWRWAYPSEIQGNDSLRRVWAIVRDFFETPDETTKPFNILFDKLMSPPHGLRAGLLPLLIAAGLKASGRFTALRKETGGFWEYVDDIKPSTIEAIAEEPERHELQVVPVSDEAKKCLERLVEEFSTDRDSQEGDFIREFYDSLEDWKIGLPQAALTSNKLDEKASALQMALKSTNDPVELLFGAFPHMAGQGDLNTATVEFVCQAKWEIEGVTENYVRSAISVAKSVFSMGKGKPEDCLLQAAFRWANELPDGVERSSLLSMVDAGVITRSKRALAGGTTPESFARALSIILSDRQIDQWDDLFLTQFTQDLNICVQKIEEAAISMDHGAGGMDVFLESRIANYASKLAKAVGDRAAKDRVMKIMERSNESD